jgi:hypothetical protein
MSTDLLLCRRSVELARGYPEASIFPMEGLILLRCRIGDMKVESIHEAWKSGECPLAVGSIRSE